MSRWRLIHNKEKAGSAKAPGTFNKGLARRLREYKRNEAETRSESVLHEDTRAHRLGRCCTEQEDSQPSRRPRRRKAA